MNRRGFIKRSTIAAGLASSLKIAPTLAAGEGSPQKPPEQTGVAPEDNRSADYLRRAQEDEFLPKPPVVADSSQPGDVRISPMPLAERVRRKIVPRRGFCSIAPGSGALLSGNGAVSIELAGDPYTEQIPFRHEMPVRAAREARRGAQRRGYFPARCGKCCWTGNTTTRRHSPTRNGVQDSRHARMGWVRRRRGVLHASGVSENRVGQGLSPHGGFRKHRGEGSLDGRARRVGSSDFHLPARQPRGPMAHRPARTVGECPNHGGGGRRWRARRKRRARRVRRQGRRRTKQRQMDFNEQRLIYKGRLDPSVNNRGYAGVTRVVRDGGSARMDGNTLVIENAVLRHAAHAH